ncbi:MAG TPA: carbohydrate kinase [Gammaproteobacteria bacterium]|jgi:fructokinase
MAKVLCFGEALIDMLLESAGHYRPYPGGAPANVAVALARLGIEASFMGMLAEDAFGDLLLESLHSAGVTTSQLVRTREANTALAFVSLDAQGERRFSFYRPPAADLLFRAEHFQPEHFHAAAAFHCCSNSLTEPEIAEATLEGVGLARAAGAVISVDMNYRPGLWPTHADARPRIWSLLREADVVKLSASELAYLAEPMQSEAAAIAKLWEGRAQWLLITDGPALIRHLTREREDSADTFEVKSVNTTGAGDAFMAGILAGLAETRAEGLAAFLASTEQVDGTLRLAAACGALAVTKHGAFEAMPTRAEVEDLMERQP